MATPMKPSAIPSHTNKSSHRLPRSSAFTDRLATKTARRPTSTADNLHPRLLSCCSVPVTQRTVLTTGEDARTPLCSDDFEPLCQGMDRDARLPGAFRAPHSIERRKGEALRPPPPSVGLLKARVTALKFGCHSTEISMSLPLKSRSHSTYWRSAAIRTAHYSQPRDVTVPPGPSRRRDSA